MARQAQISDFLSVFSMGGARSNRYVIDFTIFPQYVANKEAVKNLSRLTCKSTTIPSAELSPTEIKYMGRTIKIPGDRTMTDWTVTILNDNDFTVRQALEQWQDNLMGFVGNVESVGVTDYTTWFGECNVVQLDRKDEVKAEFVLQYIYPVSIGEITLSYDQENTIEEYQVTFAFNQLKRGSSNKDFK